MTDTNRLPLLGRDRILVEKLAKILHRTAKREGDHSNLYETPYGHWFEVGLSEDGHVARVTVKLLPRR